MLTLFIIALLLVLYEIAAVLVCAATVAWTCWRVHLLELALDPLADRALDWWEGTRTNPGQRR